VRARSAYRFLPAFFPPLAFFAIVCYPPLHRGLTGENARVTVPVAAAWHAHPMPALFASGHLLLRPIRWQKGEVEIPSPHYGWPEFVTLIPDVDYE
jgi:hypothetical protein